MSQTFIALATAIAPGNGKSMLALAMDGAALHYLALHQVFLRNVETGTVLTPQLVAFELRRFTTFSAGTAIAPVAYDTRDTLPGGVASATGATISGESDLFDRWKVANSSLALGTLTVEALIAGLGLYENLWRRADENADPIFVLPGQGVHLKCATNETEGSFDVGFVFTVEVT